MLVNGLVFIVHQNPTQTEPFITFAGCSCLLSSTLSHAVFNYSRSDAILQIYSRSDATCRLCVCGSNKPLYPIRILLLNHTQKTHIFTNVFATTDQNDGTTTTTTKNLSYLDAYKFICVASARFRK